MRRICCARSPRARTSYFENGADTEFFDTRPHPAPPALEGARYAVFVGTMDYFPNSDAAQWFAAEVYPRMRQRDPHMQFVVVGKNPGKEVLALGPHRGHHRDRRRP